MAKIVRVSKFRHVFAEPAKPEATFTDLELSTSTGDANYIRCNTKFFSVSARGGGGPILVMPFSATGKLPRGYPLLNGHSAAVLDTAWSPFDEHLLASGSDDATVKLWTIPEGGLTESIKEPLTTLVGHSKPVSLLHWNPVAANVLASVGKEPSVRVWDVVKGVAGCVLSGFEGLVQDAAWNYNGSQLVTSDKAKSAKIWDVRAGSVAAEWKPHTGSKPFKVLPLGSTGCLVTVGFTAQAKREFKLWDIAAGLDKPLTTYDLDQSAGAIMPFYDEDTRMMYLAGKGDGNIRYFEFTDDAPFVHYLSEYRSNVSTKGADMVPKRGLDVMHCEVARLLKLTPTGVEPMPFIVPRKEQSFQEDIFPESYAGIPACTADEWFGGKNVTGPKRKSLDPAKSGAAATGGAAAAAAAPVVYQKPAPVAVVAPSSAPVSPVVESGAGGGSDAALQAALAKAKTAEARVHSLLAQVSSLESDLEAARSEGGGGAVSPDASELRATIEALQARVAELEASEAKLKKAVAVLSM